MFRSVLKGGRVQPGRLPAPLRRRHRQALRHPCRSRSRRLRRPQPAGGHDHLSRGARRLGVQDPGGVAATSRSTCCPATSGARICSTSTPARPSCEAENSRTNSHNRPPAALLDGWNEPRHDTPPGPRVTPSAWPSHGPIADPHAVTRRAATAPKGALVRGDTNH